MWKKRPAIIFAFYATNILLAIIACTSDAIWELYIQPNILFTCFIILGLVTSDFLSPSLSTISKETLHISDRISGMTLLALGNAVPDITSTYKSMQSGATSLAISEALGAVFFLITVILGMMGLTRTIYIKDATKNDDNSVIDIGNQSVASIEDNTINYSRKQYLEDILLFFVLISLSLYALSDGVLTFWECIIMIVAYVIYVVFQIYEHKGPPMSIETDPLILDREISTDILSVIRNTEEIDELDHITFFENGIASRRAVIKRYIQNYLRNTYHGWVRMKLRDCLDIWNNDKNLSNNTIPIPIDSQIYNENTPLLHTTTSLQELVVPPRVPVFSSEVQDESDLASVVSLRNTTTNNNLSDQFERLEIVKRPQTQKSLSCDHLPYLVQPFSSTISPLLSHQRPILLQEKSLRESTFHGFELYDKLMSSTDDSCSLHELLILLYTTPISFLLNLYIPTESYIKNKSPFSKIQIAQLALSPIIISLLLYEYVNLWVCSISAVGLLFFYHCNNKQLITYSSQIIAIIAFIVSLVTIFSTVQVVVTILTNWAENYRISGAIIGLTVFAWGNSVGDLVSNITFVQIGVIDIALCACLGSPLLVFVFGIGIDGILVLLTRIGYNSNPISRECLYFEVDSHFFYTSGGIFSALFILIVVVPLNGWKIDSKVSILLLTIYSFVTLFNIYLELG